MESNGIFSAGESALEGQNAPEVQAWERSQEGLLRGPEIQRGSQDRKERLGEIIDENESQKVGMGENNLMTGEAIEADERIRESNALLRNYGGMAVAQLAGRGADPVTDKKVVEEQVREMERMEAKLRAGDVAGFYDEFDAEARIYRRGQSIIRDGEVEV